MSGPVLDIGDVRNLVCRQHEAALAADPSVNSIAFPLEILQAAMADPRTIAAARAGEDGDIERAALFLRSVAPVCEWLPVGEVDAAWRKARELGPRSLGMTIRPKPDTPLGDLVAGRIDQAEYRRRMAELERRAADSLDVEPYPARRPPEPDRSGMVIVWLAAAFGLVLLAIAVAGIVATLEGSQP